jgi:tetratricopeptide (TPR) repeat protein
MWKEGLDLDERLQLDQSSLRFKDAAQQFFDLASQQEKVGKAYYEYSTLMDAYARIQLARIDIAKNEFDSALAKLNEASNILRSTIHFGFFAPFVLACATVETANMMDAHDPECLQGYKNAIALFEQSKLALSFRDDHHFLITVIDADIRFLISKALFVESLDQKRQGNIETARDKEKRSKLLESEFEALLRKAGTSRQRSFYLPLDDYQRAMTGAFVVSFPDTSNLLILNLGKNTAHIEKIGSYNSIKTDLEQRNSMNFSPNVIGKGKIRVIYSDAVTGRKYDEGCVTAI